MNYITKVGQVEIYKPEPLTHRSLSVLILGENKTVVTQMVLDLVWKVFGYNCVEVKLHSIYKFPNSTNIRHRYDLTLKGFTQFAIISRQETNRKN